jgi:Ca-activated chloride channel family protein
MKKLLPLVLVATVALTACSQATEKLNSAGNDAFANQDYAAALAAYEQASTEAPELAQPHFNAANAYYRQEDYPAAQQQIEQTLIKDDGSLTQDTVYNLGNTFFQGEQYEQAIVAYQEALRLNPEDMEAKHNLELALQQQQEQQQDQQQDQNQDQQQENQDQNNDQQDQQQEGQQGDQQQDQQQEGQPGDQQQDQQQEGQPGDQQQEGQQGDQQQEGQQDDQPQDGQPDDQQQEQPQDNQPGNQPQGGQPEDQSQDGQPDGQPQIVGLSEEQARQLFEAATQGTESLEEHLQQILVVPGGPPAQDW